MVTGLLHCRRETAPPRTARFSACRMDAGGEMVDVEEALEQIGVLDLVLQLVEQLDLAVHQRLEPHGRD